MRHRDHGYPFPDRTDLNINVNINLTGPILEVLKDLLASNHRQEHRLMKIEDAFTALSTAFDEATTRVNADIADLQVKIANLTDQLGSEDEDLSPAAQAQFDALAAKIRGMDPIAPPPITPDNP